MESSLKNMVVTLLVITLVSASAVGFVYKDHRRADRSRQGCQNHGSDRAGVADFRQRSRSGQNGANDRRKEVVVYTATQGQDTVGYAVETFTNTGFGGEIKLMVGFLKDGTINRVRNAFAQRNARSGQQNRTQQIRLCRAVRRQKSGRLQTGGAQGRRGRRRHHRFDDLFARLQRRRESGLRSLQIDPKQRKP